MLPYLKKSLITCLSGQAGLHENPVRAGYVDHEIDYPYSSARDYAGEKGFVFVELPF
jgi:hypothetical protein